VTGRRHAAAAFDERADIHADERRRHEPEERQHRIAAADVRRVHEHVAILLLGAERFEPRARIGDRDELRRRRRAAVPGQLGPEMAFERIDFDRRSALARDDEERFGGPEPVRDALDRLLVGRVDDGELALGASGSADVAQDLGAEAAAAHAQQVDVRQARAARLSRKGRERRDVRDAGVGRVEPSQAVSNRVVDAGFRVRRRKGRGFPPPSP
jgi:hypothetical protein